MRPFGALVLRSAAWADLIGREHTFLVTIVNTAALTFLVACCPVKESIRGGAPATLIVLRDGAGNLALGGEYGAGGHLRAEHAPQNRRGLLHPRSFQTTATLGFAACNFVVILFTQTM